MLKLRFNSSLFIALLTITIIGISCDNNQSPKISTSIAEVSFESTESKRYAFDVEKKTTELTIPYSDKLLQYFNNEPKKFTYQGTELPKNWEKEYYNIFFQNTNDDVILTDIINQIKSNNPNQTDDELLLTLIAFVQGSIEYDWDKYFNISSELSYPYETIVAQKGVCSDKSVLLAKLLDKVGYDVALLTFPEANHMAVGIKVKKGLGNFNTNYAFIETTGYSSVGIIPENYLGGVQLDKNPQVFKVNKNKKAFDNYATYKQQTEQNASKYGRPYLYASAEEKILLENIYNIGFEIEQLKSKLKEMGCEGELSGEKFTICTSNNNELNGIIKEYNSSIKQYNKLVDRKISS